MPRSTSTAAATGLWEQGEAAMPHPMPRPTPPPPPPPPAPSTGGRTRLVPHKLAPLTLKTVLVRREGSRRVWTPLRGPDGAIYAAEWYHCGSTDGLLVCAWAERDLPAPDYATVKLATSKGVVSAGWAVVAAFEEREVAP